ncbi:MAG TPA: S8 family serine peptidase, partial [Clostridia bacterium]|nr:S8 family serine peptidase [Clostridia bacterium]
HPDLFGRTPAFFHYGSLTDAADEHGHGTHVAGIVAGNGATGQTDSEGALYGLGVAPGANIVGQRLFGPDGEYEPPANGYSQLTRDAIGAGAEIGSNSWGDDTQGRYDVSAMEFDELVRDATGTGTNDRPYILEFSAGNAGPGSQTIGSPAVGKNVIATGASQNNRLDLFIYADGPDAMADFSSRGPCEDGRIKPDIVAPGTWIASLQSASATDQYAWLAIDSLYQYQGGTSQAGPHASGAAAVFVQYYRETHDNATPSPALVKAALINSAYDMDNSYGTGSIPNNDEGWGLIDLTPIVDPYLTFQYVDQTEKLTNGAVSERRVLVAGREEALKITLTYTDVPGFPGAIPALVNDLDLEVLAPDGKLYRGNQFHNGESVPNSPATDTINNVEGVHLLNPVPGEYIVRVRATHVAQDILGASGAPRQDFALVISGLLAQPGVGALFLDRNKYTAPSQIQLTLIDTDQAGQPTAAVRLTSTTETNGENLLLSAASSSGTFTGLVTTATGPALSDSRLQITHNDSIQAAYLDVSGNATRFAQAVADLVPPVLGTPSLTNSFGREIISWSSDEPATSVVWYGTNSTLLSLNLAKTHSELVTAHSLALEDLASERTYFFYIVSADEAGNVTTNSSGGKLFSFVAPAHATLLVVDSYGTDPISSTTPDLTPWTEPLNALGVSYEVWDASELGPPTNVLKGYRAVFWRVPELFGAWSLEERSAISNYLHSGGSLFVASMQLLSRLELDAGDAAFSRNVLQVQSYVPDPDSTGAAQIIGSANETVGNGIDISLDYTLYEDRWSIVGIPIVDPVDISETMTPSTNATAVLRNDFGDVVGLRWPAIGQQAPGRLVFFSFPLDAVPAGDGLNDRLNLVRNVVAFLAPGVAGLATVSLDSPAYTLPRVV